jgi:hypothetical protein
MCAAAVLCDCPVRRQYLPQDRDRLVNALAKVPTQVGVMMIDDVVHLVDLFLIWHTLSEQDREVVRQTSPFAYYWLEALSKLAPPKALVRPSLSST